MSKWFRWYRGTVEDGKLLVVTRMSRVTIRDTIAVWAFLLEDASHDDHRGACIRDADFIASMLDFKDGAVPEILQAMQDVGLIHADANQISICNWGKRQFESDLDKTAARRQQERRARLNGKGVTHLSLVTDPLVTGVSRRSDTDTDTEKKDIRSVAKATRPSRPTNPAFETFKAAYPKRSVSNPWKPALILFERAIKNGTTADLMTKAAATYCAECQRNGILDTDKVAQAQTWLRQERYSDYLEPDGTPTKPKFDISRHLV